MFSSLPGLRVTTFIDTSSGMSRNNRSGHAPGKCKRPKNTPPFNARRMTPQKSRRGCESYYGVYSRNMGRIHPAILGHVVIAA
jgi:hypothetical protein